MDSDSRSRGALGALALLVACGGCAAHATSEDTSSPSTGGGGAFAGTTTTGCALFIALTWTDDGALPEDVDGDGTIDSGCGDTLTVTLQTCEGDTGSSRFGMNDPRSDLWTGEDCVEPDRCHPFVTDEVALTQVCGAGDVELGRTTLFHEGDDPFLRYAFFFDGTCMVAGADLGPYEALGCILI